MTSRCGFGTQLEVLGSLQTQLLLSLAFFTFQTKHNLSCGLGLLVEHWLGLSSESHLFGVITTLALRKVGCLAGLVLCDLVDFVLLALAGTVCLALFWDVHHDCTV